MRMVELENNSDPVHSLETRKWSGLQRFNILKLSSVGVDILINCTLIGDAPTEIPSSDLPIPIKSEFKCLFKNYNQDVRW